MTQGFQPPRAPGASDDVPPARWEARPAQGDGAARMVVATSSSARQLVRAGEHPPRNAQAIASLVIGIAGLALLVVSVGLSFIVSLPCAIIALNLGREGRRRAMAEGIGGQRAARAGIRLGIAGCVLCVLAAVAWILVIVLDVNVGTDFGRPGPTAPTEFSTVANLVRLRILGPL
jgi:hypothetical protein